jgi:hypothetical protein
MTTAATAPLAMAADEKAGNPDEPRQITVLHSDYFEQIIPEPPVCCGRTLKPLSIGRYRRMARFKVAFVGESESHASAGDLLMGVLICSMTCEQFDIAVAHPKFIARVKRWGRRQGFFPPGYFKWPFIGRFLSRIASEAIAEADAAHLQRQISIFQKYIVEGAPDLSARFWNDPEHEGASGSHWSHNIESVMREFQNWTGLEIDEQPLSKALWDFYKHLENRGMGRFLTEDEIKELNTPLTPEQLEEQRVQTEKIQEFLKKRQEGAVQNG